MVGCGGNGSAIASGLPYLHQALLAFGHPGGLEVTLIDPDTVSETNCVRQPFCRTEIGLPKAVVLAHRTNLFWGLDWQGIHARIQQIAQGAETDLVIGCVDTRKARREISEWAIKSRVLYWLDRGTMLPAASSSSDSRTIAGIREKAPPGHRRGAVSGSAHQRCPGGRSAACSAAEALTRQEPFINQNLAYQALAMLTQLVRHGSLRYHGGFCNLATGQLVPLPIRSAPTAGRRQQ